MLSTMDTNTGESFDLDTAWPAQRCETVREYLQKAYGKRHQTGHDHAFRGVSGDYGNLRPSFDRVEIKAEKGDPVEIETELLERFLLRVGNDLTQQERRRYLLAEACWGTRRNTGTLVVAQHRMVPTRGLDWSDDPLCALFFASEAAPKSDRCRGEVWWFDNKEFEDCVGCQWPALFSKQGHVEPEIEREFIDGVDGKWFTAMHYERLPGDRLDRQEGWITFSGRLGTCHAQEIHRLGVHGKGRLVIPAEVKLGARRLLERLGKTRESLGLCNGGRADEIARDIREAFFRKFKK